MIKKQSKTKRFFKRIEGFFASFKQRYIINYLLTKAGGKELIARYARARTTTAVLSEPTRRYGYAGGKVKNRCPI